MTIDFSEGNGTIRFYGPVPTGTSFYGVFRSEYSNRDLLFSSETPKQRLPLTKGDVEKDWYELEWTNGDNRLLDVAGYYSLKVYGESDKLWTTTLVKVVCSTGISDTVYTTTNAKERNEQIVYYR